MIHGLLNNTATVYTITETVSTVTGEVVKSSTALLTFNVRISPLSQSERYYVNKNNVETTHRMYSTYSTIFTAGDRVVYGVSTFEITGITNPSEWNKFLQTDIKYVS